MPRRNGAFLLAALAIVLGQCLWTGTAAAGTARDYAYLFVQGKISTAGEGRPIVGATVRLTRGAAVHEATTDSRGFFFLDRVPVASYDVEVVTNRGETIRRVRQVDAANLDAALFDLRVGKQRGRPAEPSGLRIVADGSQLSVDVPPPRTLWRKLRTELLIFAGVAGALAL